VVLESQASGLPVVAFQAEGVCDIIQDGITGWLAEVGTPELEIVNFERAILSVLSNPERRRYASMEAIRWAKSWTWSEAMEKAVDAYREVIRG
jgi:L-malate glycosyltransferase